METDLYQNLERAAIFGAEENKIRIKEGNECSEILIVYFSCIALNKSGERTAVCNMAGPSSNTPSS